MIRARCKRAFFLSTKYEVTAFHYRIRESLAANKYEIKKYVLNHLKDLTVSNSLSTG
jgi:hypothetical protein